MDDFKVGDLHAWNVIVQDNDRAFAYIWEQVLNIALYSRSIIAGNANVEPIHFINRLKLLKKINILPDHLRSLGIDFLDANKSFSEIVDLLKKNKKTDGAPYAVDNLISGCEDEGVIFPTLKENLHFTHQQMHDSLFNFPYQIRCLIECLAPSEILLLGASRDLIRTDRPYKYSKMNGLISSPSKSDITKLLKDNNPTSEIGSQIKNLFHSQVSNCLNHERFIFKKDYSAFLSVESSSSEDSINIVINKKALDKFLLLGNHESILGLIYSELIGDSKSRNQIEETPDEGVINSTKLISLWQKKCTTKVVPRVTSFASVVAGIFNFDIKLFKYDASWANSWGRMIFIENEGSELKTEEVNILSTYLMELHFYRPIELIEDLTDQLGFPHKTPLNEVIRILEENFKKDNKTNNFSNIFDSWRYIDDSTDKVGERFKKVKAKNKSLLKDINRKIKNQKAISISQKFPLKSEFPLPFWLR